MATAQAVIFTCLLGSCVAQLHIQVSKVSLRHRPSLDLERIFGILYPHLCSWHWVTAVLSAAKSLYPIKGTHIFLIKLNNVFIMITMVQLSAPLLFVPPPP